MSRTKERPAETPPPAPDSPRALPGERPVKDGFPVVGIGASAGGLEAFTQLLAHLPEKTGMAFVLIQHLDPNHESQLADLLSKATRLPVVEVSDGTAVSPDHIYVIPPATSMTIVSGVLQLSPRGDARVQHLPLDIFFRSLAEDRQSLAIGVILSGTGSDGTLGLAEIKAVGGITFAQDDKSARYPDMPLNAINGGCIDFVLPPDGIAGELARIGRHAYLAPTPAGDGQAEAKSEGREAGEDEEDFKRIIGRLRSGTGVDFSHYRDATLRRRMARRMAIHRTDTLAEYVQLLERSPPEVEALYQDILINVTSFFRDPEVFEALKSTVFPEIIKNKSPEAPIRIWVPGCSTGQEVYSLAIALLEFLEGRPMRPPIQLFGTDINDAVSVEKARVGLYPHSIESEISPERLRRHFTREDHGYRIGKSIRDMCVFARQNVAADPPFSRLDLISCRNLLIYLSAPLQKRIVPTFHYALHPGGYLLLGTAETVGSYADLFSTVDKHHSIYRKTSTVARPYPYFASDNYQGKAPALAGSGGERPVQAVDMQNEADRVVLGQYAPAGVLINEHLEIVQFRGQTGPYLVQPAGQPTHDILKMARDTLFLELRSAIEEAKRQDSTVRRQGVRLRDDEHQTREINLEVIPIRPPGSAQRCMLVLFEEIGGPVARDAMTPPCGAPQVPQVVPSDEGEVERLRRELASAKEYMQAILEQQSAFNEELRSANEEILSSNEELQSTNEELQTAKEELQSTNEELRTVNDELQSRNQEVSQVNDDLVNALASVKIPIVMLGRDLRIRRFTPAAGSLLNLIPTDVGRPLGDIRPKFEIPNLEAMLLEVIADVAVREQELRDRDGRWYLLRMHPYRTTDNRIDGAVLALLDIDERQRAQEASRRLAAIVESSEDAIIGTTMDGNIVTWNEGARRIFEYAAAEVMGRPLSILLPPDRPEERSLILEKLRAGERVEQFETVRTRKDGGSIAVSLTASLIRDKAGRETGVSEILRDITERKKTELALAEQARELARSNAELEQFAAIVSHDLRSPLSSLSGCSHLLLNEAEGLSESSRQLAGFIQQSARQMSRLIEALLHYSRVGRNELRRTHISLDKELRGVLNGIRAAVEASGAQITHDALPEVEADPSLFAQLLQNLVENAIKYRGEATPRIHISARKASAELIVSVADNGIGIDPKHFDKIFEVFTRLHADESQYPGIGAGLATCKKIVEKHGGRIWVESQPGQGSTFSFSLPA